jgi:hypothetical protein
MPVILCAEGADRLSFFCALDIALDLMMCVDTVQICQRMTALSSPNVDEQPFGLKIRAIIR